MGNMSYCRFRNTVEDLEDCYDNWEAVEHRGEDDAVVSEEELRARKRMLKICQNIIDDFGEEG